MTTRLLLLSMLLLLVAACGGGGGAAPIGDPNPDPDPDPDPLPTAEALELLQTCAPNALEALGDFLGIFQQLNGGSPGVLVVAASADPAFIDFQIDPTGGDVFTVPAALRIEDTEGNPAAPGWTEQQMLDLVDNGVGDLPSLLDDLDGLIAVLDASSPDAPSFTGSLAVLYTAGVPDEATGEVTIADGDCTTVFSFTDLVFADLTAIPFPTASFDVTMTEGADTLVGTLNLTGTLLATALMKFNDSAEMEFSVNLLTGEVLLVP